MSFFPPPLVATSIAQFQHILFFGLLRRHKRRIICSIFLVATFLFFRAPGRHNLLSNSRFGYGLLFSYSAERVRRNLGRIVCVLDRVPPKPLRNLYKWFSCFFFTAPLPRSSPPLSNFNRCFPGAISAATCCAIPTHGFLAPLSRHIHCVVATHLSTSSPLGRHIRCAISTSVFLSPPFVAASAK